MKYTVWAECKDCVHFPEDHLDSGCVGLLLTRINGKTVFDSYGKCRCPKHIPLDNLKYLEWLYENSLSH